MAKRSVAGAVVELPNRVADHGDRDTLTLTASTPLRLDGPHGGWLVQKGHVDLFAVALHDGEPAGMRHPLCQISPGELIAAFPGAAGHTIIAVGRLDTLVGMVTREQLDGWPLDRHAELIDRWIGLIAAAAFGDAPAWPELTAESGSQMDLAAGKRLFAPRGPVWAVPRSGTLVVGDGMLEAAGAMPIAAGLSLRAQTDCSLDLVATAAAIAAGIADLDRFHAVILMAVGGLIAQAEQAARQRIAARAVADRRSVQSGLRSLSELGGDQPSRSAPLISSDPVIAAFATVVAHLGVELSRTPRTVNAAESALRSLARANGVGLRSVLLRGEWWRADNGALLAWRGEEKRPVALLPDGPRRCRLWDPADGSSVIVDQAIAREIDGSATMAYRPMPREVRGVAALVRFALRGIRRELTTIVAVAAAAGALAALFPVAIGYLFETAVPRAETGQVLAVVFGLGLAAFGAGMFDLTKAVALLRFEGRIEAAMQPGLMHRMLALPVNFYRGFGTGELTNRVLSIQTMRQLLAGSTLVSLLSALFATLSFTVILFISPFLALVSGALVAMGAVVSGVVSIGELRQERARVALRGQEDGLVIQVIQGVTKLRVAASETRIFAVWAALFARQKRRFLSGQRYAAISEVFNEVYPILAILVLFFAASRMLTPGANGGPALGLGSFLSVNAAFGQLLAATTAMARAVVTALELVPLFERLRPIVTAEIESHADKSEVPPLSGRIEISHVHFRYGEGSRPVLDDVSLRIEAGSFAAFVGPSGSGKSTLLRLLLGFEMAERGDILYDGRSISTLDAASLRRQIGVVLQNGRITTGSIFDNITSGLPYSLDDAWTAARLAGIDGEIEAMPMGMHTLLLEGSSTLSGGQRQRLMIARALIGKPRVLFFDEATSALDNRSQALVTRSLEKLRTTRIVIAHRLSTIERADRIFVLEGGRLVESGNFSELMARDGLFRRLAQRQIL
jgi:NHLM bacteriocin system ABC transporter ATP-binding protein